ncbi:MAG TPA: prepilin-type N-terminal cleavage/methylation domain-containing protein [Gemmatimonadales bacterium]|nr:prepilin-type N-terminal cleavage/methylation domain-containing protein [Gemmatimonadales bacterium]
MSRDNGTAEAGVTLVEVLIALGILSVVLVALGGLMFQVSLQTRRSAALSYRSAAAQKAQAYVEGLPWDSLGAAVGCVTETTGQLTYSRCLTVQTVTTKLKRITVVLTSTGNLVAPPETLVVDRAKPQLPLPIQ